MDNDNFTLGRLVGTQELLLAEVRLARAETREALLALDKRVAALEAFRMKIACWAVAASTFAGAVVKYVPDLIAHGVLVR